MVVRKMYIAYLYYICLYIVISLSGYFIIVPCVAAHHVSDDHNHRNPQQVLHLALVCFGSETVAGRTVNSSVR